MRPVSYTHLHKHLLVCITREQVKNSPEIDTRMPISRQHEIQNANHYGYPYHWSGDGLWGDGLNVPDYMSAGYTGSLSNEAAKEQETREQASTHAVVGNQCDPHLRNYQEVIGYEIHATDGDIGHVKGMLVEEESWACLLYTSGRSAMMHRIPPTRYSADTN